MRSCSPSHVCVVWFLSTLRRYPGWGESTVALARGMLEHSGGAAELLAAGGSGDTLGCALTGQKGAGWTHSKSHIQHCSQGAGNQHEAAELVSKGK